MAQYAARKSGTRAQRRRQAARLLRDRKIYRSLRVWIESSRRCHRWIQKPIEPLSVYGGKQDRANGDKLTVFPRSFQANGQPMPHWNDLTAWLKLHLTVLVMNEWDLLTFSIHLHPNLAEAWSLDGRDIRKAIRDRMRREFAAHVGVRPEHFFVIEGRSKYTKAPTVIHVHGAAVVFEHDDEAKIMRAATRALGHGIKGAVGMPRAKHQELYRREGPAYINYLMKSAWRSDERLSWRRVTFSQSTVEGAREFWNWITDR